MDPTDILRERVSELTCSKYNLPPIVLNHGKTVSVICCCREFANELRTEIATAPEKEVANLKVNFVCGKIEYV